jgi:predicted ATPase
MAEPAVIRTPDQRLRVFVSSTLGELAPERAAARQAIERLRLVPVMFELGARPHPPRELYRAYLAQSQVFVGIYWERYGWVAPGETVSGLEDEYLLAGDRPRLLYLKDPAHDREARLTTLLDTIREHERSSYKRFSTTGELTELLTDDLAILLTERFEAATARPTTGGRSQPGAPRPLGSIVGRDAEVAAIVGLLEQGARLVTVTGAGGIGKTRLALAVAATLEADTTTDVYVVPLAGVDDPALVLPTVAARLGIRLPATVDATTALRAELTGRRILLVLDSLEHLIEAATDLVELLERCPDVRILATSRRPLRAVGERELPLDPLQVAGVHASQEAIGEAAAVRLFVERARAVAPGFTLDADNAASVAELCRRLDGLPLAIELAASRVRLFQPAALLRRLGDELVLPAGGPDRPERQRTVRATIDWSARLLSDGERVLFARLSVFRGGCTLGAAEEVCDLEGRGDVAELVAGLLDQGLLVVVDDQHDDEPRVRMLAPIRADAAARLVDAGETEELQRRHLRWAARLADEAQPFLCGPAQVRWMARIDPERENLSAAAAAAGSLGEPATLLEMAWDLYVYYHLRGAHLEPEQWVRVAAASAAQLDARQQAIATTALAISALWRGETGGVREALEGAVVSFERDGLTFERAVALMHLGLCALDGHRWDEAAAREAAAIDAFASVGHDWGMGSSENLRGVALLSTGDVTAARSCHERALAHGEGIGNAGIAAQALTLLAATDLDTGDPATARERLASAAVHLDASRDVVGAAGALEVTAAWALAVDDPAAAGHALALASAIRERLRTPLTGALAGRVGALAAAIQRRTGVSSRSEVVGAEADPFATLRDLVGSPRSWSAEGHPGDPADVRTG